MRKIFFVLLFLILIAGAVSAKGTTPDVSSDMVLYYHLNNQSAFGENDTRIFDFSNNGNNATTNMTSFVAGSGILSSGAYYFNVTTSQFIQANDAPSFNFSGTGFTVSAWLNTTQLDVVQREIVAQYSTTGNQRGWYIKLPAGGGFAMKVCATGAACSADIGATGLTRIDDNNFHHVVGQYNLSDIILYVDGINYRVAAYNNTVFDSTAALSVGKSVSNGGFNGTLDEIIIYNRTLSAAEVRALYRTYATSCKAPIASNTNWNVEFVDNCTSSEITSGNINLGTGKLLFTSGSGNYFISSNITANGSQATCSSGSCKIFLNSGSRIILT